MNQRFQFEIMPAGWQVWAAGDRHCWCRRRCAGVGPSSAGSTQRRLPAGCGRSPPGLLVRFGLMDVMRKKICDLQPAGICCALQQLSEVAHVARPSLGCRCVAFGDAHSGEGRCLLAGYENGDVKMFDLRAGSAAVRWETNVGKGVCSLQVSAGMAARHCQGLTGIEYTLLAGFCLPRGALSDRGQARGRAHAPAQLFAGRKHWWR